MSSASSSHPADLTFCADLFYEPRPLRQYVVGPVHISRPHSRSIGFDELFFDLIIVACIAVMGDNLRVTFTGWAEVRHFILLYGAAISIWRETTILYNQIGSKRDLFEQATFVALITCLAGVGLGAASAFRDSTRSTAASAFIAHAILAARTILSAGPTFRDARVLNAFAILLAASPYLAAVFSGRGAVEGLFWAALAMQVVRQVMFSEFLCWLHRKDVPDMRIPAIDVHALSERWSLITLITFGETFISTLVEGNKVFQVNERRDVQVVLAIFASVIMVYSLHTLYFDIDGRLLKGDEHALQRGRLQSSLWMILHYPLHIGLLLAESSLGIMVEIIGEAEEGGAEISGEGGAELESAVERLASAVVRNAGETSEVIYPTNHQVWLFTYGTATALVAMLCISFMHGKRRRWRLSQVIGLAARVLAIIVLLTAVPLAGRGGRLNAIALLFTVSGIVAATALWEFFWSTLDEHLFVRSLSKRGEGGEEVEGREDGHHDGATEHAHFPPGLRTAVSLMPRYTSASEGAIPFKGYSLH